MSARRRFEQQRPPGGGDAEGDGGADGCGGSEVRVRPVCQMRPQRGQIGRRLADFGVKRFGGRFAGRGGAVRANAGKVRRGVCGGGVRGNGSAAFKQLSFRQASGGLHLAEHFAAFGVLMSGGVCGDVRQFAVCEVGAVGVCVEDFVVAGGHSA